MIQLFIGGVRSGKSHAAEVKMTEILNIDNSLQPAYIATSLAWGEESKARIALHQQKRKAQFNQDIPTYELNYQQADLISVLNTLNDAKYVVLIECLSTWVGWYLSRDQSLEQNLLEFESKQVELLAFLRRSKCSVIIVTGEVGCGLIGETVLQRRYADRLGELNQKVAELSDRVSVVTAGIEQVLK